MKTSDFSLRFAMTGALLASLFVLNTNESFAQSYAQLTITELSAQQEATSAEKALAGLYASVPAPVSVLTRNPRFIPFDKAKSPEAYIAEHLCYPEADRIRGTQGHVTVQFDIAPDGRICRVTPVFAPSQSMADEAVRVTASMPDWLPALVKGVPVTSRYRMRIAFSLR